MNDDTQNPESPNQGEAADDIPAKLELADDQTPAASAPMGTAAAVAVAEEPSESKPEPETTKKKTSKAKSFLIHTRDFTVELVKILAIVLLLRAYVVQASSVEGHSMENTLWDGDLLLVERFTMSLVNGPEWLKTAVPDSWMPHLEAGDIVVLTSPENGNNELVKRVIAIQGDYIFFYDGQIYVNGQLMDESYLGANVIKDLGKSDDGKQRHYHRDDVRDLPSEFTLDRDEYLDAIRRNRVATSGVRVPDGCVFVMGDNRRSKQSNDSRAWSSISVNNGPEVVATGEKSDYLWVTTKSIHGRVLARLLPPWDYDDQRPVFPK